MELVHRKILQTNRTNLIDNIANPLDVVEKLFEKNIFTEAMKEEVEVEKTKHGQVRKILDKVPKRGPQAFNIFYECLLETSNDTAADFLAPDLAGHHPHNHAACERGHAIPQPAVDLPADLPNVPAMTADNPSTDMKKFVFVSVIVVLFAIAILAYNKYKGSA